MKILVFGATGTQQFHIINEAQKKGAEVFAAVSSEKSLDKLKNTGANPLVGNMASAEKMEEITKGMDAVALFIPVSLKNPLDGLTYGKNIIDASKKNGVKKIVWNTSGWLVPQKIGIPSEDVKLDIKEYLINSEIDYVIIEPTIYMENLMGPFCAPFVIQEKKLAYPTPEAMPIGWIASRDVSAFVVEAIFNPTLTAASFQISGMENLKGNDLAKQFSKGLGETITYYSMPSTEFGNLLKPFVGDEGAKGVAMYYEGLQNTNDYPSKFNPQMSEILKRLPIKMTTLEEWAKDHKNSFNY